jgi:hypothetical protein
MNLSLDLSREGLEMFFKPYQVKALETLWKADRGLSSREVWDAVDKISRASVINFLNDAVEELDLLEVEYTTGKGGHRGIYIPKRNEKETREYLKQVVTKKLITL